MTTEQNIEQLLPLVQRKARELIKQCKKQLGIDLLITSSYRSIAEQNKLYAQGRTTPGAIVTKAKGGQSFHNFKVAFDVCPLVGGKLAWNYDFKKIGKIWESLDGEWGGNWVSFKDMPHMQYTIDYPLKAFQDGKVDYKFFN